MPFTRKRLRSRVVPFIIGLLVLVVVITGFGVSRYQGNRARSVSNVPTQVARSGRFIYAAQDDGFLQVYDIDNAHRLVQRIQVIPGGVDIRGVAAAAPTHRFYIMYNANNEGHLLAFDLSTDQVLWDHVMHAPGVDRGDVTPDGRTLYLPTWESDPNTPYELVVDPLSGTEIGRIPLPVKSHDTIVSLDGKDVFMETKSATAAMYVADTTTNRVIETISGYCCSGVLAPFAINGTHTLIVNDVNGYAGFQLASITTGHVLVSVPFTGVHGMTGHGIAWTPNEREVWVNDGNDPLVHVFDMTTMPPRETQWVTVSDPAPHWLTFSIDGRFAYVAGQKGKGQPTDIIDTTTYQRIGALGPSEDLLEVDFSQNHVVQIGNQFGIGRITK